MLENGFTFINCIRFDFRFVFDRLSDEDDESNSMESDPIPAFGNLQVDDKNANCGAQGKLYFFALHALKEL